MAHTSEEVAGLPASGADSSQGIDFAAVSGAAQAGASGVRVPRRLRRLGGRKAVLDVAGLQALQALIESNRRMTQDELVAAFTARRGKAISKPALAKGMKALGYRKTKLRRAPSAPAPQTPPRYSATHRREPTATTYPSTLTDREAAVLEPLLAKTTRRGRPETHSKRLLMNAIFYQLRTGAPWRYLPKDFPHWSAVWSLFRRLRDSGTLERMYDALHQLWRQAAGRAAEPTAGIVDSQTVKTTEKGGPVATTRARKSRAASAIWSSTPSDFPAES